MEVFGIIFWFFILFGGSILDGLVKLDTQIGKANGLIYSSSGVVRPDENGEWIDHIVVGVRNVNAGSREIFKYGVTNTDRKIYDPEEVFQMPFVHFAGDDRHQIIAYPINHPEGDWRQ